MDALNHGVTALFDALLWPLERVGPRFALVFVSGVFGVIGLFVFKYTSPQRAIKAAKDKIKAHLIAIRIYQDSPRVVFKSFVLVLARNVQYLTLNVVSFVPLALPFVFVIAQMVVRYGFAPVPLMPDESQWMAGRGVTIEVQLAPEQHSRIGELTIRLPDGVVRASPLVRVPSEGRAFQEVRVTKSGAHAIDVQLSHGAHAVKQLVAGEASASLMQPERGKGLLAGLLWPAEDTLPSDSAFERISFRQPDSDLGWMGGGPGGVLLVFLIASMLFGALAIKPLKIQI